MRISGNQRTRAAFSWLELLAVIVTVMLLFVVFTIYLSEAHARASRIGCVSRLKQIGLATRMWSKDHEDHFPWTVSTNKGGTMEFAVSTEVFRHFLVLSNEMVTPVVLACPNDRDRLRVKSFSAPLANENISYFIGLEADEMRPQSILIGDRNIVGGMTNGALLVFDATNTPSWTRDIHNFQGNIGLGDGSVQQFTTSLLSNQFQAALRSQTNPVIRLAIPRTSVDRSSSFSVFRLSLTHLVALAVALAVLAFWIIIRRGVLAAAMDDKNVT